MNSEFKPDEFQEKAIRNICSLDRKISVLTGSAGRGKTTILAEILKELWNGKVRPEDTFIATPTGKAAVVVNKALKGTDAGSMMINPAGTIHRVLGCRGPIWEFHAGNRLQCSLFIVDEASMVDVELMARIINSIAEDAKILLVLDDKQLLPVGPGSPAIDIIRADLPGQVNKLVVNYRQKSGEMLGTALERILDGEMPEFSGKDKPGNIFFHEVDNKEEIPDAVERVVSGWYHDGDDWIALSPQWKGEAGINAINEHLQEKLNPHEDNKPFFEVYGKPIRLYDKVRHTKNNYKLGKNGVFNGFCGEVLSVGKIAEEHDVLIQFNGQDNVEYKKKKDLEQLVLGYCISIHASQGSQYRKVCVVIHSTHSFTLCRSLLYVACSRAQVELHIVGDKLGFNRALKKDINDKRDTYISLMTEMEEK